MASAQTFSFSFDERTLLAYPRLVQNGNLPDEARSTAPVPPPSTEDILDDGIESLSTGIWEWADSHPSLYNRLIQYVSDVQGDPRPINRPIRGPGSEPHDSGSHSPDGGEVDDASDALKDVGGRPSLRNAVDLARDLLRAPEAPDASPASSDE